MSADASRLLAEWRKAERLLQAMPAEAPERIAVEGKVEEMRALYRRLTRRAVPLTDVRLQVAQRRIEEAQALLDSLAVQYLELRAGDAEPQDSPPTA